MLVSNGWRGSKRSFYLAKLAGNIECIASMPCHLSALQDYTKSIQVVSSKNYRKSAHYTGTTTTTKYLEITQGEEMYVFLKCERRQKWHRRSLITGSAAIALLLLQQACKLPSSLFHNCNRKEISASYVLQSTFPVPQQLPRTLKQDGNSKLQWVLLTKTS